MRRTTAVMMAVSIVAALAPAAHAAAGGNVALTWVPGSTVKVEQLIGDCDYTAQAKTGLCTPTTSRTITSAKVVGTDLGASVESQGKLIFLFGDTLGPATAQNYFASDTIASTVSTDPDAGLALDFFTNLDGTPYFIRIPGVPMARPMFRTPGFVSEIRPTSSATPARTSISPTRARKGTRC